MELKDKLHYFVDSSDNFWLLSHPHNNVLFIQVYNCQNRKLVKKIFHEPEHNGRKYLINELIDVREASNNVYEVKVLTYESHEYVLKLSTSYDVESVQLNPSHEITSWQVPIGQDESNPSYSFIDPLNKIFEQ